MAAKSGSNKKSGRTRRRVDAADKGRLISELKDRVAVLEKELRSKQGNDSSEDVAERKRAEEALRESEARLRLAQQVGGIGTFEWNMLTGVNTWTPELEAMYGLPPCGFRGTQEAWEQLVYPEDRPLAIQRVNEAIDTGSFEGEWRVVWPDGSVHWLYGRAFVFKDKSGKPLKLIGVNIDITERKHAEEALKLTQASVDRAADGIFWITPEGRIYYANDAICGSLQYSRDELQRMYVWDIDPLFPRERWDAHWQEIKERGSFTFESLHRAKDGSEHPVLISVNYLRSGDREYNAAFIKDITEWKRAEEELVQSKNYLDRIINTVADPIFVKDRQHRWILLNDAFCTKIGHSREELLGMSDYDFFPQEQADVFWSKDEIAFETGEENVNEELFTDGRGVVRTILTKKTVHTDGAGEKILVGVISDITEQKRAEEALLDAKQQAELYLDLMGHDINNMHQIALAYLELAQGVPPGVQLDEMIGKSIEVLQRSTQLIRNVRKLQKLNEDFFQMHEVDVEGILHAVWREFGAVPGKSVTLNINGEGHCFVRANELLHDVFANLVGNAIKHTGDKADINIDLDIVNDNGKYCRVSVEDNGPGIPDDFKGVIFNRALKGTKKAKGIGLGLYLVKSLVDSYGGHIWVEDRVAGDHTNGARFVVMLPAVDSL